MDDRLRRKHYPGVRLAVVMARWGAPTGQLADLIELAGRDVEDEPADLVLVRDERAGLDPADGLPNVLIQVGESLSGPGRLNPGLVPDGALEGVVGEGQPSMPQSAWWIRMTSVVPSSRWLMLMAREQIWSSVLKPPALRITCA